MALSHSMFMKLHYICYNNKLDHSYIAVLKFEIEITAADMRGFSNDLESNDKEKVEEFKLKLREQFNASKDPWIINGMYDYYMVTNSTRALDILVTVREPHDKFLFDRLYEGIKSKDKMPALLLLSHVVRRQPIWLFKISQHLLFKELLRLLKTETDTVIIVCALLVLNVLLPVIPALIGPYLQDIFEIFSRFAAWNSNNPNKLADGGHLLHLQIALYTLFHRLYGMFPCNFLSYLRQQYSLVSNTPIFSHTIKPMLSTVRVNPLLITMSKEYEISNKRWMKLQHHDIIVQCAKLLIGGSIYQSPLSNNVTDIKQPEINFDQFLSAVNANNNESVGDRNCSQPNETSYSNECWSPTVHFNHEKTSSAPTSIPHTPNPQNIKFSTPFFDQQGPSPPETGIEATPETTPIRMDFIDTLPSSETISSAKRVLNAFIGVGNNKSAGTSPISHQFHQDSSPFKFPPNSNYGAFQHSVFQIRKIETMVRERNQVLQTNDSPNEKKQHEIMSTLKTASHPPTTPSVLSMISTTNSKNFPIDVPQVSSNSEDKEVQELLLGKGKTDVSVVNGDVGASRCCDSVLQEVAINVANEPAEGFECCEQEQVGSPCSSGGLHMPDTHSMMVFAQQVHRLRYYSQCNSDTSSTQTLHDLNNDGSPNGKQKYLTHKVVRRANSCPDINRDDENLENAFSSKRSKVKKILHLNGISAVPEQSRCKDGFSRLQVNNNIDKVQEKDEIVENTSIGVQTEDLPPYQYPYEHLFLSLFPQLDSSDPSSNANRSCPALDDDEGRFWHRLYSPSSLLQQYIESVLRCDSKDAVSRTRLPLKGNVHHLVDNRFLGEQLLLLSIQLQFEEYRREVHAERNRRLLGRSRNIQALEEHNSALRDQVGLLQKELENSANKLSLYRLESKAEKDRLKATISHWQNHSTDLQTTIKELKNQYEVLVQQLKGEKTKCADTTKSLYETQAALLNVGNELKCVRQEAAACRKYKSQVQFLQREVLKAGEMIMQYRNIIRELRRLNCSDVELDMYKKMYTKQVHQFQINLHSKMVEISALKSHCFALQADVKKKKQLLEEQKLTIDKLNEKYTTDIKTWKDKHESMKVSYNRELEYSQDLQHKLTIARTVHKRYSFHQSISNRLSATTVPVDETKTPAPPASERSSIVDLNRRSSDDQLAMPATDNDIVAESDELSSSTDAIKNWLRTDDGDKLPSDSGNDDDAANGKRFA